MIAEVQAEREAFHTLLKQHWARLNFNNNLNRLRQKSWDHFLSLGLPSKTHESFRSIKLKSLFSQTYEWTHSFNLDAVDIQSFVYPECQSSVIVFVNGSYEPSLSCTDAIPQKVEICSLEEGINSYETFLHNQWTKSLKEEKDPFAALNGALHQNGAFLYIPPNTTIDAPIQILHFIRLDHQFSFFMPRLQIFVGKHSQAQFIYRQKNQSKTGYFVNLTTDLVLDEASHVQYTQILNDEHPSAWHFEAFRATLKRDSHLKTISITEGNLTIRQDYHVILAEENSEAYLNGVSMLSDKKEAHTHILMDHQAPSCRSYQLFKNVLSDFSRSSFEGKILVRQLAQKTEAFQLNNNLLLNDYTQAYSKPNLEIFADDVKASHGATFGQPDEEQLFYMKTRGLPEKMSTGLLIFGFCEQVIDLISIPTVHREISHRAHRYLAENSS